MTLMMIKIKTKVFVFFYDMVDDSGEELYVNQWYYPLSCETGFSEFSMMMSMVTLIKMR